MLIRNSLLLFVLAALPLPVLAQQALQDPLANDPRLLQKVAVSVEGISVGDLLALLSKKTGTSLTVKDTLAEEKVMVFGPPRPLRDLLHDLAALFNNVWMRGEDKSGPRYIMVRSRRAQEFEEGLRQRVSSGYWRTQMDSLADALRETPEQIAKRPEGELKQALEDPNKRRAVSIYALLDPTQRAELFARHRLLIPFAAFSPVQQQTLRRASAEKQAGNPEENAADSLQRSGVLFFLFRFYRRADDRQVARVSVEVRLGKQFLTEVRLNGASPWHLPAHGNPYTGKPLPANSILPDAESVRAGERTALPDRLRNLANTAKISILADYYRAPPVNPLAEEGSTDKNPDVAALDAFCHPYGYLWWTRNQTLLLRKRDWVEQSTYEIPDRWILATMRSLQSHNNAPSYGDLFRILELTPRQTATLEHLASGGRFFRGEEGFLASRQLLALLRPSLPPLHTLLAQIEKSPAALTEDEARSVSLTYNDLSPEQQRALLRLAELHYEPVDAQELFSFHSKIYCEATTSVQSEGGMRFLPIIVQAEIDRHDHFVINILPLPTVLPDDRRDKTRVEVVP